MERTDELSEETAEALREVNASAHHPFTQDNSDFARWLRAQARRRDAVGMLARVALTDPTWPGAEDRRQLEDYFKGMGARSFVIETLRRSFREFDEQTATHRSKAKAKAQRQARRQMRQHTRRRKR